MPELIPVLKKDEIEKKVGEVAGTISADYNGTEPILIGVLKGSFVFLSDLIRKLSIPVTIDFLGTSSYGDNTSTSGHIRMTHDLTADIRNRDILIVEDIIDTGLTLAYLVDYLKSLGPNSVRICTFIDKRERRQASVTIDYACLVVEAGFLVGYGLDYAGKYRQLPELYHLKL